MPRMRMPGACPLTRDMGLLPASRRVYPGGGDRPRRSPVSTEAPVGLAAGTVLEGDIQLLEAVADLVAQREVLRLAGLVAEVDEELHQAAHQLIVAALLRRRLPEQAEDLAQL